MRRLTEIDETMLLLASKAHLGYECALMDVRCGVTSIGFLCSKRVITADFIS